MENKPESFESVWSLFTGGVEVSWPPAVLGLLQTWDISRCFRSPWVFCSLHPRDCALSRIHPLAEKAVWMRLEAAAAAAEGAARPVDAAKIDAQKMLWFH